MTKTPFTASAKVPVEYIPTVQDVEAYERAATKRLQDREAALKREESELARWQEGANPDEIEKRRAELALEEKAIAGGWDEMRKVAAAMRETHPKPQRFLIQAPTSVERDQVSSRMIALGLSPVTQEQTRALMIEELYHVDWAEPGETLSAEANEMRAEEHAMFLDSAWLRQEAHDAAVAAWKEQEIERVLDEEAGAPRREGEEAPPRIITVRENARLQLLIDRMMSESQRLRDLAARASDTARIQNMLLVRIHVVSVDFETAIPVARDPRSRALTAEMGDALREAVDDASWHDLVDHITRLYQVDGAERKNSDSLPGKPSPGSGSTEPTGAPGSSDGSSTGSPSGLHLVAGSETTTVTSSSYGSGSDTGLVSIPPNGSLTDGR